MANAILQLMDGPWMARRFILQPGETIRVGSGDLADLSIPDTRLAQLQLEFVLANGICQLTNLEPANEMLVNGNLCKSANLTSGDSIQVAGALLSLTLPDSFQSQPALAPNHSSDDSQDSNDLSPPTETLSLHELVEAVGFPADVSSMLTQSDTTTSFLAKLVAANQHASAILLIASSLPKDQALRWARRTLEDLQIDSKTTWEADRMEQIDRWIETPNDATRRSVHEMVSSDDFQNPWSWLGLAVFWSGKSIAPPNLPDVPPDRFLMSKGIYAALQICALQDPKNAISRYLHMIQTGIELIKEMR
jgi:hypothetical protein